jgi:hypothetical protein
LSAIAIHFFSGNSIHLSCIQPLSFNASLARF